ncbi:MAG: hypothetical protein ACI4KJ_03110 [Anaerovoracaceae bacterium]
MEVISFTGKSGTGKSYQATKLCVKMNIDAIIDDGLLIYKGQIVAGTSAKKCETKAGAVRTAVFEKEENRLAVKSKLEEIKPERIMVLGTSDKMVSWITKALDLPSPSVRLYIEDVTTEEEREKARYSRTVLGEHVVPAPMGQLKRSFAGYFMNPLRYLKSFGDQEANPSDDGLNSEQSGNLSDGDNGSEDKHRSSAMDRTVVRPQFMYHGKYIITDQVVKDIIRIVCESFSDSLVLLDQMTSGKEFALGVTLDVRAILDESTVNHCLALQMAVHKNLEMMTSFSISRVNVRIKDVAYSTRELNERRSWRK